MLRGADAAEEDENACWERIGRGRLSLVCETRSGKCSMDDDEDKSNQQRNRCWRWSERERMLDQNIQLGRKIIKREWIEVVCSTDVLSSRLREEGGEGEISFISYLWTIAACRNTTMKMISSPRTDWQKDFDIRACVDEKERSNQLTEQHVRSGSNIRREKKRIREIVGADRRRRRRREEERGEQADDDDDSNTIYLFDEYSSELK